MTPPTTDDDWYTCVHRNKDGTRCSVTPAYRRTDGLLTCGLHKTDDCVALTVESAIKKYMQAGHHAGRQCVPEHHITAALERLDVEPERTQAAVRNMYLQGDIFKGQDGWRLTNPNPGRVVG